MRHLRSYTSKAHTSHFCDYCCRYIQPGEIYEGNVYATDKHGIIVSKQHINPACDWPDFEEYAEKDNSSSLEKSVEENISLNLAA